MKKDFVKLSKEWFNKQAPVYDETNTILYSKYGKISCENIYEFLKDKDYKKLLDIGCGTGYLINMLSKEYEAEFTGIDLSPEMIKQAKGKNIGNAIFVEGKSDELPFEENTFDAITTVESFYFWENHTEALRQIKNVLKPGGKFLLIADIYDTGSLDFDTIYNIHKYKLFNPTKEKFEDLFHIVGFNDVKVHLKENTTWIVVEGKK